MPTTGAGHPRFAIPSAAGIAQGRPNTVLGSSRRSTPGLVIQSPNVGGIMVLRSEEGREAGGHVVEVASTTRSRGGSTKPSDRDSNGLPA